MKKWHYSLLILIFLLALGTRLYFSFNAPTYSSDKAYFTIRQITHIQQTSEPLYDDALSFSGRRVVFPPLFGYAMAFIGLVFPMDFTAKFFPNLFAASLVFVVYLIARKISKSSGIALFTAFVSSFVPVFLQETFNSISVYSIVIPLYFLLLYCFMNIGKKKWLYCYLASIIVFTLIHPSVILFIIGLWFYLLLLKIEGMKHEKAELEIIIFSTFFVLLSQFIIFKKIFLFHGPLVIWQNIPKELLSNYFAQVSIVGAIYYIGIIPFLSGIYIIYRYIFKQKDKDIFLLIGFVFAISMLLWLRLIEIKLGLIFLGLLMVLLFAEFWSIFTLYISRTKASRFISVFSILILLLFIATSIMPAFSLAKQTSATSVTKSEVDALLWMKNNTPPDSVVLASVYEGNLVTAIAQRKNVIDSNFIFIKDAGQRYEDVGKIYTTFSLTEAVSLLNKYNVDFIYFSPKAKKSYGIDELKYAGDKCFLKVYDSQIQVYKSLCRMEELK